MRLLANAFANETLRDDVDSSRSGETWWTPVNPLTSKDETRRSNLDASRLPHNPEVAGSNPAPATRETAGQRPCPVRRAGPRFARRSAGRPRGRGVASSPVVPKAAP